MLCTKIVLNVRNNFCTQHVLPRFELGISMYWTCNSMKNLSSYCGLIDAKIRASGKYLPVRVDKCIHKYWNYHYGFHTRITFLIANFHFLISGAPASTFGQPPPPSYGATANPSQSSQGGFNFGAAAASPPSFAFGSAPAAPSSGAAPAAGGFAFGGSQQATPTFGAMPQTPQQQQQSNM